MNFDCWVDGAWAVNSWLDGSWCPSTPQPQPSGGFGYPIILPRVLAAWMLFMRQHTKEN
jgi:hypothetical protein